MLQPPASQKRPVKVAFFMRELGLGGAERWAVSLANSLVAARPVGMALRHNGWVDPTLLAELTRVMPVYLNDTDDLAGAHYAFSKATESADAVLCWGIEDLASFKPNVQIPFIDVMHCADDLHGCISAQARESTKVADYVACVTAATISAVPERYRDKVQVVHNGADPFRCAPRLGRAKTRSNWRFADADCVILFIGRFSEEKNPEAVVSAVSLSSPNWKAVLMGPDCGRKSDVQRMAKLLAPNRCWFPPITTHVGDLLAMADVLCVPSRSEGHCLVVNEAWIAGLPVVTCAYEAMREFDELHGPLCWLVPVGADGRTFATTLTMAADEGRESDRVVHAREVAWNEYTTAAMAARWEAYLIDEVLPDWYSHALYPPLSTP